MINTKVEKTDFSRSYRDSIDRAESLSVKVAPIEEYWEAIKKIATYESESTAAKAVMAACVKRKKMILEK